VLLVVAPDYLPDTGGIQLLAGRVTTNLRGFDIEVVTLASRRQMPPPSTFPVRRVPRVTSDRRVHVALLNAVGVLEGMRRRPDIVLNLHVATAPAAIALMRSVHIPYVQVVYGKELFRRRPLVTAALRDAATVIAISNWTSSAARWVSPQATVEVIPVGVDLPTSARRRPAARPTVITVSRMSERYKGHDMMLRALPLVVARIADVQWIVVGEGPLRPMYESMAKSLGLETHVTFTGRVSDDERDRLLREAWMMAMISRLDANGGGEGFGIAYLEAAGNRLPVVAGNVAGATDAVLNGETGVLVDPTDHLAVAAAVIDLLSNREVADRMGRAARKHVERLKWSDVAKRYEAALFKVLAGSPPLSASTDHAKPAQG
jgi:phosphatidylinositol alpha-1,6-mannosyltransferase